MKGRIGEVGFGSFVRLEEGRQGVQRVRILSFGLMDFTITMSYDHLYDLSESSEIFMTKGPDGDWFI